jgi:hypothetical protein
MAGPKYRTELDSLVALSVDLERQGTIVLFSVASAELGGCEAVFHSPNAFMVPVNRLRWLKGHGKTQAERGNPCRLASASTVFGLAAGGDQMDADCPMRDGKPLVRLRPKSEPRKFTQAEQSQIERLRQAFTKPQRKGNKLMADQDAQVAIDTAMPATEQWSQDGQPVYMEIVRAAGSPSDAIEMLLMPFQSSAV